MHLICAYFSPDSDKIHFSTWKSNIMGRGFTFFGMNRCYKFMQKYAQIMLLFNINQTWFHLSALTLYIDPCKIFQPSVGHWELTYSGAALKKQQPFIKISDIKSHLNTRFLCMNISRISQSYQTFSPWQSTSHFISSPEDRDGFWEVSSLSKLLQYGCWWFYNRVDTYMQ